MADGVSGLGLEAASGAYSKYSGTVTNTSSEDDTTYMDFDSYLKLLVSQMQNQDFNDPMSDSEVLQQMSSYSMLEGIKNMTAQTNISYATSLVGKAVTVNDGSSYDTGVVVSVVVVSAAVVVLDPHPARSAAPARAITNTLNFFLIINLLSVHLLFLIPVMFYLF